MNPLPAATPADLPERGTTRPPAASAAQGFALAIAPVSADVTAGAHALRATLTPVRLDAPALRVGELGSQRGDGVFESVSVVDGHAQELRAHLARLAFSAERCELPAPHLAQWEAAVALALAHLPTVGEFGLRLVLDRDPARPAWLVATAAPDASEARARGLRAVTLDRGFDAGAAARAPWLLIGAKTLSYAVNMAALREARRRGADEAIFVTSDGLVLEGATSSLILRIGGEYLTPAPGAGVLQGTTCQSLFCHLERTGRRTATRDIRAESLARADAAWLVSSIRGAVPLTAIDGHALAIDAALTAEWHAYLRSPRD